VDSSTIDRNGLEILQPDECLRLLGLRSLGRLAITVGALPVILPVNFRVVGERIVFRTSAGSKLDAATRQAVVAFEADDMDPFGHTGWSVLVTGVAHQVEDPTGLAVLAGAGIPRWAPAVDDHFVELPLTMISGRRLGTAAHARPGPPDEDRR
jgi:uncharacterized protein